MKLTQFRCPTTGQTVHHYVTDDPKPMDHHRFDAISCPACARQHLVNRFTDKALGDKDLPGC